MKASSRQSHRLKGRGIADVIECSKLVLSFLINEVARVTAVASIGNRYTQRFRTSGSSCGTSWSDIEIWPW